MKAADTWEDAGTGVSRVSFLPASPWKWTLALAFASAILILAKPYVTPRPRSEAFALTATDRDGRMEVHWNPNLDVVKSAQSAVLDVLDGNDIRRYPVDAKVLQSGALDYLRNAEDATVGLVLMRDGQPVAQAVIRSVAPVGAAPQPPEVSTSRRSRRRLP